MKFSIVFLLGLCIFAVRANEDISALEKIVAGAYTKIQELINLSLDGIKDLVKNGHEQINNPVDLAKSLIKNTQDGITDLFNKAINISEASAKCVRQYEHEIDEITADVAQNLEICRKKASEGFQNILTSSNVQKEVDSAKKSAEELAEIVRACMKDGKSTAFWCVTKRTGDIMSSHWKISKNIADAVVEAGKLAAKVVSELDECIREFLEETDKKSESVAKLIKECIKSN